MRVVLTDDGTVLMQHDVETGDIWRAYRPRMRRSVTGSKLKHRPRTSILTRFSGSILRTRAHDHWFAEKVGVYLRIMTSLVWTSA
jgi:monomeric isocitrate dehydrogenase